MTAQSHQNPDEFVWFVSRWLVSAMLGPDDTNRVRTNSDDRGDDRALATRSNHLIDVNCTKEVA